MIKFDTRQLDRLAKNCVIPKSLENEISKVGASVLLAMIRKYAPRKSGDYVTSWRSKVSGGDFEVFSRDRQLSIALEYGTVPHKIQAREKDALRTEMGDYFFSVYHKGSRQFPHTRPAFKDFKIFFPQLVKAKLALRVPIFKGLTNNTHPEKKILSGNTRGSSNNNRPNISTGLS